MIPFLIAGVIVFAFITVCALLPVLLTAIARAMSEN